MTNCCWLFLRVSRGVRRIRR